MLDSFTFNGGLMAKFRLASHPENLMGGVCAGLAYALGIPVWLVRLAFVLLFLFFGTGILAYILLWLLVPKWNPMPEDFRAKTGD